MAYQVLDTNGINMQSGLQSHGTSFAQRLEAALNNQKQDRGMVLVAVVSNEEGPAFIFKHETD